MALVLYLTWHRSRIHLDYRFLVGGVIAVRILIFWLAGQSPWRKPSLGLDLPAPAERQFYLPWSAGESAAIPGPHCRT